jgi:hypothetical protein
MSKAENAMTKVKHFLSTYGFETEKFDKKSMRLGKTPDFKVLQHGSLIFYCEVKNPEKDAWLDRFIAQAKAGEIVGGLRNDPVFNRLTTHIHSARKQFDAVNQGETLPNVLAFYNEDETSGFLDLLAVTTGNAYAEGGAVLPIYKTFSEGRVKEDLMKIHLFIWLDNYKPHRLLFNLINDKHLSKLCSLFGYDQESLKKVHP